MAKRKRRGPKLPPRQPCTKKTSVTIRADKRGVVSTDQVSKAYRKVQQNAPAQRTKKNPVTIKVVATLSVNGKKRTKTIRFASHGVRSARGERRERHVARIFAALSGELRLDHTVTQGSADFRESLQHVFRRKRTEKMRRGLKHGRPPKVAKITTLKICVEKSPRKRK